MYTFSLMFFSFLSCSSLFSHVLLFSLMFFSFLSCSSSFCTDFLSCPNSHGPGLRIWPSLIYWHPNLKALKYNNFFGKVGRKRCVIPYNLLYILAFLVIIHIFTLDANILGWTHSYNLAHGGYNVETSVCFGVQTKVRKMCSSPLNCVNRLL